MYSVSNAYKTAVNALHKERYITGTIGSVAVTDANIVKDSLKIDNACSSGTEVSIGSVYIGQLSCVFRGIHGLGGWFGKDITLTEHLKLANNTYEGVPYGVFTATEADRTEEGVSVVAYDAMKRFDKTFSLTSVRGEPYDIIKYCCDTCGVTMAQTRGQIRLLPNGNRAYVLYSENSIETHRDVLHWVSQFMACFCTINRSGYLEIRRYGDYQTHVDEIGTSGRWMGASVSEYVTRYTGVSVVDMKKEKTVYKAMPVDDGLTYNLGENPFLQGIQLDEVLTAILTELQRVQYTPFAVGRSGCPAYDLGDVVKFPGGIGGGAVGCIMHYNYTYHGEYKIEGFGANPALMTARSKTDKEISGLLSKVNAKEIQFYTFENLRPIEIHDAYREIAYIRFVPLKDTVVTFQAEILLDAEPTEEEVERIVGEIQYLYNGVELDYHPVETWVTGDHILHLLYFINADAADVARLSVRMKCDGEITIPARGVRAAVSGQGLAATSSWDGWIEVEDNITEVSFGTSPTTVDAFGAVATVTTPEVIVISLEDAITEINIGTSPVPEPFTESLYINKEPLKELTWGDVLNLGTWQNVKNDYAW